MNIGNIRSLITKDFLTTALNFFSQYGIKALLLLFIPLYLDDITRGYWFTFGSVAALSMIADMGFTTIVTQFSAHEYAYCEIDKDKLLFIGQRQLYAKLGSLFKFVIKWVVTVTSLSSVIIFCVGYVLFSSKDDNTTWLIPWLIYVMATGANFVTTSLFSFFEGCDYIALCQRIKLISNITNSTLTLVLLYIGCGLYALAIPMFISVLLSMILIHSKFGGLIRQLTDTTESTTIWLRSIVTLLWRYALSWLSGYLIYQIYTPLTFQMYGPEISGKVGYTFAIISAISSLSGIWNYISIPRINVLVERKDWLQLDIVFRKNIILIEFTFCMSVFLVFGIFYLPYFHMLVDNYFLWGLPVICLICGYFIQLAIAYIGVYLRAHKMEPLMSCSIATALLSTALTYFSVHYLSYHYIYMGYFISSLVMFPLYIKIFNKYKKKLHN